MVLLFVEGFDNEEEAIALANDSIYGLAGAVFSKDIGKAQRVANKLKQAQFGLMISILTRSSAMGWL